MTKVFDCVMFLNELDILEIRMNILNNYVDFFVITESDSTFSGNPKSFIFEKNINRFQKFKDKIIYNKIVVPKDISITWDREIFQRNSSINVLSKHAEDCDFILTSDVDEIPSTEVIEHMGDWYKEDELFHFQQKMYVYYLNNYSNNRWFGSRGCNYGYLKNKTIDDIRQHTEDEHKLSGSIITNAGWHFTYLGGEHQIKTKINSFSHQEHNTQYVRDNIKNFIDLNVDIFGRSNSYQIVPLDDSYPKYILDNKEKYSHLIKNVSN
jgi:beta-1,4-mannosyl-glycoprotein beta-1,4-N-acetylglucosaminyltransferase